MTTILQGENRLLERQLTLSDGITGLPVASLARVSVTLEQRGAVLATYTLGSSTELRAATDPATLTLELTSAFTGAHKGAIRESWLLIKANSAFVAEPAHEQVDRIILDDVFIAI